MKNNSRPFAALCALLQLLLRAVAATPLRPVHLLPLVKGRNNESSPKLRVYGAPNRICRPRDHLQTARSFVYYAIVFPTFCQKAVFSIQSFFLRSDRRQLNKQTKRIIRLNDSTFSYKRKRNKSITLYCHIPYVGYVRVALIWFPQQPNFTFTFYLLSPRNHVQI